jgi:hypothetical protein
MPKFPMPIAHDVRSARPKRKPPLIAAIVVVGGLLAPLAAEGAALFYAQWCEALDGPTEVRTPIIDWLGDSLSVAHDQYWEPIAPSFEHAVRDPLIALPAALVLIVVAMLMLKR